MHVCDSIKCMTSICLGNQIDFGTGLGIVGLERGGLQVVVEKFNDRSKRATESNASSFSFNNSKKS